MATHLDLADQIVHLARLALSGRPQDVQLHVRRLASKMKEEFPEAAQSLTELLREGPTRSSPLRRHEAAAIPVDLDTRLQLVRVESPVHLPVEPIYDEQTQRSFDELVLEHRHTDALAARGLVPTRTVLFTGPPGVGKTLGARWIAHQLGLPLMILDLSAVMSSFLGRTGNNVRHVLDYAKATRCVLLLDEFDAIAKRRDDGSEVGELKRLVTVLLQEVDDWPAGGLLIAATNHAELLDPAVWRRFERLLEFSMPSDKALISALRLFLRDEHLAESWLRSLAVFLKGSSFSGVERMAMQARRAVALTNTSLDDYFEHMLADQLGDLDKQDRIALAAELVESGVITQRRAHEITGVSRDTIRKRLQNSGGAR